MQKNNTLAPADSRPVISHSTQWVDYNPVQQKPTKIVAILPYSLWFLNHCATVLNDVFFFFLY